MNFNDFENIVFFTGAGMSAESGIPTYRGAGGVWHKYNWQEYACQEAFDKDPVSVLKFHELRRESVLQCSPHKGHDSIFSFQKKHQNVTIVTQNIDGMHQRSGCTDVIELHGSLWRVSCPLHGVYEDIGKNYRTLKCEKCQNYLRPDIVWFGDMLDSKILKKAEKILNQCDLFISVGTSGVVWPAAGFPQIAKNNNAYCVEVNLEKAEQSIVYDEVILGKAGSLLPEFLES